MAKMKHVEKGVILAGGEGLRLESLTRVTNKHLVRVYDRPMIEFPIATLQKSGIEDILIVSGKGHAGQFLNYLGRGEDRGLRFSYTVQEKAGGIAQALSLAEDFSDGKPLAVILGDNIFEDDFKEEISSFEYGARIFLKDVPDPERFGVVELSEDGRKVISVEEKPKFPKTNYAVTGLYLYDNSVFKIVKTLKPSPRGELEITDVNNYYIGQGEMDFRIVRQFWSDAGTIPSLLSVDRYFFEKSKEEK